MGRRPNAEPSIPLNLRLPESARTRLDLILFSTLEGRVPAGAYQRFFLERLAQFFASETLDLAPYVGSLPGTQMISGSPSAIAALRAALEGKHVT